MQLCDVTLREGDQRPGRSYSADQKLRAGRALDRLGVDYIQAGFPITGETDRKASTDLAAETTADIVRLARAKPEDVEAAGAAEADVVEIFVPASDKQVEYMLGEPRAYVWTMTRAAITTARSTVWTSISV